MSFGESIGFDDSNETGGSGNGRYIGNFDGVELKWVVTDEFVKFGSRPRTAVSRQYFVDADTRLFGKSGVTIFFLDKSCNGPIIKKRKLLVSPRCVVSTVARVIDYARVNSAALVRL